MRRLVGGPFASHFSGGSTVWKKRRFHGIRPGFNDFGGVQLGLGVGVGTGSDWSSPQKNPRGWTGVAFSSHGTRTWLQQKSTSAEVVFHVGSDESELEACLLAPRLAHVHPAMPSHWSPAISSWGIVSM